MADPHSLLDDLENAIAREHPWYQIKGLLDRLREAITRLVKDPEPEPEKPQPKSEPAKVESDTSDSEASTAADAVRKAGRPRKV